MFQHKSAAAKDGALAGLLLLLLAGGCASSGSCERLALPLPGLREARLRECVADVLEDERRFGRRYSLEVRAGTRDLIVNNRMVEFREALVAIARSDANDPAGVNAIRDALYTLSMLNDREAVAVNLARLDAAAPAPLLTTAINNLAFLHHAAAAPRVAELAAKIPLDVQTMTAAFNYLSAARYSSAALCARLPEIDELLHREPPAADPGTAEMLRQAAERYAATAACARRSALHHELGFMP